MAEVFEELGPEVKNARVKDIYRLCAAKNGLPEELQKPNCGSCLPEINEELKKRVANSNEQSTGPKIYIPNRQ
jgi:hypothetical protein